MNQIKTAIGDQIDDYLDDPYHSLKSADETILRGLEPKLGLDAAKKKGDNDATNEVDTEPEEPVDPNQPTMADVKEQVDLLKKTGDPKKAKEAWAMFIEILQGKSDFKEPLAHGITHVYYKNMRTPEAQAAKELLKKQLSRILIFPIGLWILINWWYLINHTTFTVNVMKYTENLPGLIKPIFEAPLYAIDVLNYYLINMREDKDLSPDRCELLGSIWSWRPVVFFVMLMIFSSIYAGVDLKDAIATTAGMSSTANGFMFGISIFAFLYFNLCESRLGLILKLLGGGLTGIIVTAVLFLLGFILMLVFCSVATGFYSTFIIFLSFFSIIVFGFPNILSEIQNLFRVVNSAPVNDPNTTNYFTKVKNIVFQNFVDIILAITLIPILLQQMQETYANISNQSMMMTMLLFQAFILFSYFKLVTYPILHPIIDVLEKAFKDGKTKTLAAMTAAKEMVKETSGFNRAASAVKNATSNAIGAGSAGEAFGKIMSAQGENVATAATLLRRESLPNPMAAVPPGMQNAAASALGSGSLQNKASGLLNMMKPK